MIDDKVRRQIRETFAETRSIRAVERRTGHSRKLIRKVLRGETAPRVVTPRRPRESKLDPFKPQLRRLIEEDGLTAILALGELRELGYEGGYSIVKEEVRRLRPPPKGRATTVVEHPPGEEGQVDWSPYRVQFSRQETVVHGFSLVLPFSSYGFLQFAMDEVLDTLLELHDEAFEELACVPLRMTYDNMTTVGRHVGPDEVWINPRFAAYAEKTGFEVNLTRPGHPNDHASVERRFHYIENNCLRRRRFRFDDLADLNRHARWWCDEIANVRIHGTTRRRPVDLFRYEKSFCKPLPRLRPDLLHPNFLLSHDDSREPEAAEPPAATSGGERGRASGSGGRHPPPTNRKQRGPPAMLDWVAGKARAMSYKTLPRKVATDHCVAIDTNRYSVSPRHGCKPATIHLYDDRLEIIVEGEPHAVHVRSKERHQRFVLPEHEEEFKRSTPSRRLLEQAFLRLGEGARPFYEGLCAQRGRGAGYHLQRVLRLADRYGSTVVSAAMAHAARFGSYSAESVARVVTGRTLTREAPSTPAGEAPMPPERVRRWLEGLDVEARDLDDFDQIVDDWDGGPDGQG